MPFSAQTCTVQENLLLLRYTLEGFQKNSGKAGALVLYDQAKAFDRDDRHYLMSVLTV